MPADPGPGTSRKKRAWVRLSLLAIVLFSMLIRVYPLSNYFIWGSDSGEYYLIADHIVEEGAPPGDYEGWGFAYPYFTGMETLAGTLHLLSGLSLFVSLFVFIPLASSLLVLPIFLIAQEVGGDHRASLIAAAIIATITPNVFPTSHAMPGAICDFLQLMALLSFIKIFKYYTAGRNDKKNKNISTTPNPGPVSLNQRFNFLRSKNLILFFLFAFALALTHHLSLYFLFLVVFFITIFDALTSFHRRRFVVECVLVFFLVVVPTLYWALAIPSFRENVMDETLVLGGSEVPFFVLFPIALLVLLAFFFLLTLSPHRFADKGKIPSFRRVLLKFLIWVFLLTSLLNYVAFFGVPGTEMDVPDYLALYFASFVLTVSFAPLGRQMARSLEKGFLLYAWFAGIAFSFIINSALENKVLLAYRHLQYVVEPVAIFAGFGVVFLHDYFAARFDSYTDFRKDGGAAGRGDSVGSFIDERPLQTRKRFTTAYVLFVSALIFVSVFSAYPPKSLLSGFEEGTSSREFESVLWVRENLHDDSRLVTDHRMSSLVFGFGGHLASWDSYKEVYASEDYTGIEELMNEENLTFILITDTLKDGVALLQWENAEAMSHEAALKFEREPFIKLYANEECDLYMRVM